MCVRLLFKNSVLLGQERDCVKIQLSRHGTLILSWKIKISEWILLELENQCKSTVNIQYPMLRERLKLSTPRPREILC